jgi:hypothetical protein
LVVNKTGRKGRGGLKLSVRELRRDARTSLVRVDFGKGGSVPSIMTFAFALYRMALDRGARYFVNLRDGENAHDIGEGEMLVGFSQVKPWAVRRYFGVEGSIKEDIHFFSVKEFADLLSGSNPFVCE